MRTHAALTAVVSALTFGAGLPACGDDDPAGDKEAFCAQAQELDDADPFRDFTGEEPPDLVEGLFSSVGEDFRALADNAPAEVEQQALNLSEAYDEVLTLLAEADFELDAVDREEFARRSNRFQAASETVEGYLADECGLDTTSPDG